MLKRGFKKDKPVHLSANAGSGFLKLHLRTEVSYKRIHNV